MVLSPGYDYKQKKTAMKNGYNLLISCGTLGSGGAERVISILSPYFADKFNSVTLVLWKKGNDFYKIDPRINVIHLHEDCNCNSTSKKIRWFRDYVTTENPDVVLSFLYPYSIRIILATLGLHSKIIAAERRDPRKVKGGEIVRRIRDLLYARVNRIFVQSNFNKSLYPSFLRKKIDVLYNPIQIDGQYISSDISNRSKDIVTVGRLIQEKNHKLLIDAFSRFHISHPEYRLFIYGDGPLRDELVGAAISKGLKINENIFFPGVCKDIHKRIIDASAFVLTSTSEGMPNALYEALCMGVPCISTRVTGVMDLLEDRKNALLVDYNDQDIERALNQIVGSEELSEAISKGGREIYGLLSPEIVAKEWISSIENVCRDGK